MAHDAAKLRELLERCEKATHAEIDLDLDLCVALQVVGEYVVTGENVRRPDDGDRWGSRALFHEPVSVDDAPRLTGSLDASIALVERMLPRVHRVLRDGEPWRNPSCTLSPQSEPHGRVNADGVGATLPLAVLSALLRALISQAEGEGHHG